MVQKLKLLLSIFPEAIGFILKHRSLWPLIVAPFFINLVISIIFGLGMYEILSSFLTDFSGAEFLNIGIVSQILDIGFKLGIILFTIWIFGAIGMIIAAPFNGLITEKILDYYEVKQSKEYEGIHLIGFEVSRSMEFEFTKFLLGLVVGLSTFVVNLIPLVGSFLYIALNLTFGGMTNMMDLTDSASSRLNYSLRQKLYWVWSNKEATLPFGMISAFILSVPFVNFLYSSFATVAATMLFIKSNK